MNISPARITAFEILLRVVTEDAYASNLLAASRYEKLSSADHGLAHELTLGVLRWQARLDFLIEHFTKRKIARLDNEVVVVLRLGIYQLIFLDRVPAHAAINDAVNLIKLHKKKSAAPMVNAVLRAVQRTGTDEISRLVAAIKDPLEKLAVATSHPRWLLENWLARFGLDEAQKLATANNEAPNTAFRFNRKVQAEAQTRAWLSAQNIQFRPSRICPDAFVIEAGKLSAQSEAVRNSWIYLQDEASQLVAHLAVIRRQDASVPRVLDLCAAPGSKTSLMASLLPENSLIVACDLYAHRLHTLRELASKSGLENLHVIQLDATKPLPFGAEIQFDTVLLDAPCSGLGTLQRHPEIKWKVNADKIRELSELQQKLILNAASQVKAGRVLTYSVCSTEPAEGEEIIAWLLTQNAEFRDVTMERMGEIKVTNSGLAGINFGARTFTHLHGCESFFVCVLQRGKEFRVTPSGVNI